MSISDRQLSSLLATSIIPGILRLAGVDSASGVEDFFSSRLCAQLLDARTGMWQLGCTSLARAYERELAGQDYQLPEVIA